MTTFDAYEESTPDIPDNANWETLARLAVEFTYERWTSEHTDLFLQPKDKRYWTVRLGRLALCRDGTWAYWERLRGDSKKEVAFVRRQRFESLEDAITIATKVFGKTPEHALFQRDLLSSLRSEK